MNELQIFQSEEFGSVRTMQIDGEPWFVGRDVADILGYSNTRDALVKRVDEEDKGVAKCDTLGGAQELTVINESGLYSLILSSKLPAAKRFKRWVTDDILPAIRKHGAYMTPETIEEVLLNPDTIIKIATQLKEERMKRELVEKKNAVLIQQTLAWDKRAFVLAAIRRLAGAMPSYNTNVRYAQAWGRFKKEFLYKHHINLERRLTEMQRTSKHPSQLKLMDALPQEHEDDAVATIIALCEEEKVNIEDLIANINVA